MITSIKKRDGRVLPFDSAKIDQAIARAFAASGSQKGEDTARELTRLVMEDLDKNENISATPGVEEVQDAVERILIEKGFVRQLNPVEIHTLAARIGIIHCTGCGAPVDIRKKHACDHCKAPIAILDPQAVEQALSRFQQAEVKRSAPPDFEKMADALLLQEKSTARFARQSRREQQVDGNLSVGDLLLSGVALVLSLLNK